MLFRKTSPVHFLSVLRVCIVIAASEHDKLTESLYIDKIIHCLTDSLLIVVTHHDTVRYGR